MGINFDGNGNPTTYKAATFSFDPEDRLTAISGPAFSAAYDGDGLRATKTAIPVGGSAAVTTYFLYDGGHLLLEETWNGTAASLANVNGWAADGLRARLENGVAYDFAYDPQGNLIQRQSAGSYAAGNAAYDQAIYEGYGALRQDVKLTASKTGGAATTPRDPVGFGGQFGYYTDTETGLLCLTHRYYDPGTGKFITRDPIGYEGGMNLYGFCGGNPVNEIDPSGFAGFKVLGGNEVELDGTRYRRCQIGDADHLKGYPHYDGGNKYIDRDGVVRNSGNKLPTGDKVSNKDMPKFDELVRQWDENVMIKGMPNKIKSSQMPELLEEIVSKAGKAAGRLSGGLNALGGLLFFEKTWGELTWINSDRTPKDYKSYRHFLYITNPDKLKTLPSQKEYEALYYRTSCQNYRAQSPTLRAQPDFQVYQNQSL